MRALCPELMLGIGDGTQVLHPADREEDAKMMNASRQSRVKTSRCQSLGDRGRGGTEEDRISGFI